MKSLYPNNLKNLRLWQGVALKLSQACRRLKQLNLDKLGDAGGSQIHWLTMLPEIKFASCLGILPLILVASLLIACDRPENRPKVIHEETPQASAEESRPEPLDLSGFESDSAIEQKIRQQIEANNSLSPYAKNVNVTVINGVITLRGITSSLQEKEWLSSLAHQMKSAERVHIQLETLH